ncbi:hypothetical protein PMZ80_008011 [Knufia obscura]|uniref:Heterokaryon incompatibility domain-containing protein n=2 Tax=Knufia TaxID=430999 RepID=A0AAN8IBL0_9EURO|nr:hypothetical protein PMZ80_008011 [Knufia obscura]KAK5957260.1 hypothetical protein OHC33_001632 [Knufia fluminis]
MERSDQVKVQHHRNFVDLVQSAKTCVLCLVFAKQAPVPPPTANFTYDGTKQIVLSATSRKHTPGSSLPGLALDNLVAHLPIVRKDDKRSLALPASAQLVAEQDSNAAKSGDVVRRRTYGGTKTTCAVDWLSECVMNHKECRKSTDLIGSLMYAVPPRLLDLGSGDTSPIRLLETDHNFASPYVALTYTRGDVKVFSTNRANVAAREEYINVEKFNKTFKQAISLTRQLGFRYLWIDAFCIVMDDPEDRTKHVPRMGIVFHNAALTLSAAVSATADEGLVRYKAKALPEAKIPYRTKDGIPLGHFHVTNYKPRGFNEDITQGDLNSRAWCLQARALSRRTLHFGHDQLFWECDAGVWSEDCSLRCSAESLRDPMVDWRMSLVKYKRARVPDPEPDQASLARKTNRPTTADLAIPKIYALWYNLVAQYTSRFLPREQDKSSAIAGLAYVFACLISQRQTVTGPGKPRADTYICGLWQNDLPFGLLWSSGSFHKWRNKFVKYPSAPRAPSWSWLSVDGPLQWPDGVVFSSGSFTGRSFMKVLQVGSHYDRRTNHEFSTIKVRGKVALLSKLYGFRPEDAEWKRAARDHDLQQHSGRSDEAEGPINIPCAMFDSAEVARVWTMLHGATADRPSTGSSSADQTTSGRSHGIFGRSSRRSDTTRRPSTNVQSNMVHDQQKDFVALLVIPAGCSVADCQEHKFENSRLSATLPLPADSAFRAKNNCGQGLAYALILYPSSMGEGLFRRVGIAQVRIADFATVERRRDREVVIV